MFKKLSPYKAYLLYSASTAFLFALIFTVSMVYQVEIIHLNPLQLILVGTTLETTCFIFEIPTGIVADIYSRKLSIIIGLVLIGAGFALEGSVPSFTEALAAQVLWGLGATFISGSVEAWIAEEEKDRSLEQMYLRGAQIGQAGSIIGIVLSTVLANISINVPIVLGRLLFIVLSVFLKVYMPENNLMYHYR